MTAGIPLGKGVRPGSVRDKEIEEFTEILMEALQEHDLLGRGHYVHLSSKQIRSLLFELRWYTWSDSDIHSLRTRLMLARQRIRELTQGE